MMHDPSHPGEILREEVLAPLEMPVKEAADRLGMSGTALSSVLSGHTRVSPDLAIRLEKAGVSTARFWLNLQTNYDLAMALKRTQPPVRRIGESHQR